MGADESSIPIGSYRVNINPSIPISDQITIAVHGKRKVGKTSLIHKMLDIPLSWQYIPTPTMEATEFCWKSIRHPDEIIKITVWDVVDCALKDNENSNIILPDAQTVDTLKTADGIIILYDPDIEETADYAISIIEKSPENLPIICLANFLDRRKMMKKIPDKFDKYNERIVHVQSSIYSHRGLQNVAEWLDIPLLYNREKYFMKRSEIAEAEINDFDKIFNNSIKTMTEELSQMEIEEEEEFHPKFDGYSNISIKNTLKQDDEPCPKGFMIKLDFKD